MRRLVAFLIGSETGAWRGAVVSLFLLVGAGLVLVIGGRAMGLGDPAAVGRWLAAARGPWALPVAIGAFALLAFLGAPQVILIAAAVLAFGPIVGAAYSWIGTMISALIGFVIGRAARRPAPIDLAASRLDRFMALVGRNGFLASLVVRLVPFAPFIIVNMAAGMARVRPLDFAAGTAIGIVPKIALIAFAGGSALTMLRGGSVHIAIVAAVIVVWLISAVIARGWAERRKKLPQ
ncbi:MAG TPA: VTT domain-containing protein [Caulobacteraceae bacterium]